jgi:hypothetical protein
MFGERRIGVQNGLVDLSSRGHWEVAPDIFQGVQGMFHDGCRSFRRFLPRIRRNRWTKLSGWDQHEPHGETNVYQHGERLE